MRLNKLSIYTKARDWSAILTTIDRRSATLSGFETCPGGRERFFGGTYLQSCFKCIALLLSLDKDSVSTNKRLLSRKNRFCDSKPSPTVLAAFCWKPRAKRQHGGFSERANPFGGRLHWPIGSGPRAEWPVDLIQKEWPRKYPKNPSEDGPLVCYYPINGQKYINKLSFQKGWNISSLFRWRIS